MDNPTDSGLLGFAGNSTLPAIDLTNQLCNATTLVGHGALTHCVIQANGVATRNIGGTSSAVTGTAGVEWTPDNSTLAYIRYSRGYKELALNAGTLANPNAAGVGGALVAPETMDDYELGYKKTFGRNLVVDLDLFYENYLNAQFPVTVYYGPTKVQRIPEHPEVTFGRCGTRDHLDAGGSPAIVAVLQLR